MLGFKSVRAAANVWEGIELVQTRLLEINATEPGARHAWELVYRRYLMGVSESGCGMAH